MKTKRDRRKYQKAWYVAHKKQHLEHSRIARLKIRQDILNHYGNKCACCGETQPEFLALDHKNNDGHAERRKLGIPNGGENFYRFVTKSGFPDRYQLLCHNCNFSKHFNKGECVHVSLLRRYGPVATTLPCQGSNTGPIPVTSAED